MCGPNKHRGSGRASHTAGARSTLLLQISCSHSFIATAMVGGTTTLGTPPSPSPSNRSVDIIVPVSTPIPCSIPFSRARTCTLSFSFSPAVIVDSVVGSFAVVEAVVPAEVEVEVLTHILLLLLLLRGSHARTRDHTRMDPSRIPKARVRPSGSHAKSDGVSATTPRSRSRPDPSRTASAYTTTHDRG